MNQKKAKGIRRQVRKTARAIVQESVRHTKRQPLYTRLKVAWNIILGKD